MKTTLTNRILALLLALLMLASILPMSVLASAAQSSEGSDPLSDDDAESGNSGFPSIVDENDLVDFPNTFRSVNTAAELEAALADDVDAICIAADFVIDRTFYVKSDTIVYSETEITLTRSPEFAGDVFVVGQDSEGNLCAESVTFSIGGFNSETSGQLTINGNSENMTVDVVGTVIFVCPESQADLYNNLAVTNCKKVGNDRALNEIYGLSNTKYIGGAVAIAAKDATMNVYGGSYTNNSVNTTGNSVYGGTFYNFGTMSVYGGVFEGGNANRAGAFYNYRSLYIYSAIIRNNSSSANGGAIYLPASSGAKLYLGGNNELVASSVLFSGNTAGGNGGAIFASGRVSGQDAVFENNTADNGGAIYVYGDYSAVNLTSSAFSGNTVTGSGGAIYGTGHNTLKIDDDISLLGVSFAQNSAKSGGAIALAAASCALIKSSTFEENSASSSGGAIYATGATVEIDKAELTGNSAGVGGAVYLTESSSAVFNKLYAKGNTATSKGGMLYSTNSTLDLYNSSICEGQATTGSAMYLDAGAITNVYGSSFVGNACYETSTPQNAGAIFTYTGAEGKTVIHSTSFIGNTSTGLGGAITSSGASIVDLYNVTAVDNSAAKGGFYYMTTTGTTVTISGLTVSGNTASVGGPIIWGNSTGAKLYLNKANYVDLDIEGELPADYWEMAIVNKLKVYDSTAPVPPYTDYGGAIVDGLWTAVIVTTLAELKAALAAGEQYIKIVNDIEINETLYVTSSTVIFSTVSCTLTRADGFDGSLIVVGRDAGGELTQTAVTLTLGRSGSATADFLTIACGEGSSAIVVASGSQISFYDNVTVGGAIGTDGSVMTIEENATANILGGKFENNVSAGNGVIFNSGTLNVGGGTFASNVAELGGVIYNVGTLDISDGAFSSNTARLGGAIYNLGTIIADGGVITANTATENGGAIYMAGGSATLDVEISENTAVLGGAVYCADGALVLAGSTLRANSAKNGGALYVDNNIADATLGDITFNGNTAELGGAIYIAGAEFDVSDCTFVANEATSGGAIYAENASLAVNACVFNENSATNGAAIYTNGASVTIGGVIATGNTATENGGFMYANAAKVTTDGNTFSKNEADRGAAIFVVESSLLTSNDTFEYGYAFEGGAICAEYSDITVTASTFTGNKSDYNGGAIALCDSVAYISSSAQMIANSAVNNGGAINAQASRLTVYGTIFNANTANMNGGALAVDNGADVKVFTSVFSENTANKNGGAAYAADDKTVLAVQLCEFSENRATVLGGAMYVYNKAAAYVYSVTAENNGAARGGFLYMTGTGTAVTVIDMTVSGNTANYGAFVYGNSKDSLLYINKNSLVDTSNPTVNAEYWEQMLYGTVTVKTIYDDVPEYLEEGNESAGSLNGAFDVSGADELEAALAAEKKVIRIVADFEIDRTFYITYDVIIFSTARHTLTRAPEFAGDIFVIGEHADGTNSMLKKANARLTLGNPSSKTSSLLIIDGNRDNMLVDVTGTVLFICNGAVANVYDNVSVINCYKIGNEKTYEEKYQLSRPNRIGGPVAIIPFGGLHIYGGTFANNAVAIEDSSSEETRNSTLGGVFYNESNLKIYGGLFENNEGARGGIVYNYGTMKIYGGSFIANRATVSGGVYYAPSSATCQLNIGYNSTTPILFKDNEANTNGGVICAGILSAVVVYGNTTFENNKALKGSGGAIYATTTLTAKNAIFHGNSAKSRGGAVFMSRSSGEQLPRFALLENCSFVGNSAENGGVISAYSSSSDYESGTVVAVNGCEFISNSASYGGVLHAERKATVTVKDSSFDGNTATAEGGAAYVIGESTVSFNNSVISGGTATSHGGAISVRSSTLTIDNTIIENNYSDKNGGAIYIAYSSSIDRNSKVTLTGATLSGNKADNGGAIYATRRDIENDKEVLTVSSSSFASNVAKNNGGAILLTAGVDVFMKDVTFVSNSVTTKTDGMGGAIYAGSCVLEIDGGVFTKNESACMGGAINLGSGSDVKLNNVTAARNTARTHGGFLYSTFGTLTVYNSTISNNSSNMGAGMYLYDGAVSSVYNTKFTANKTTENGAAMFVYTDGTKTVVNGCTFDGNRSANFGGGLYVSGKSDAYLYNITATDNSAAKGGFMYETAAGTIVTLGKITLSGNTATDGGAIIWGNTKNAKLFIDKAKYTDRDTDAALDDTYWANAIDGTLTVTDTTLTVPTAAKYTSYSEPIKNTVGNPSASVNDVFDLAKNSSDGYINSTYDKFPILDNSSNFMSRGTTVFDNINGGTVTVDTYVYPKYSTAHNMTVGEALMIYQAMLYKQAYPEEEVYIDISSYRFSVQTAVNINRDSRYFGYTRALVKENYDEFGFVRVAYLLVSAAKMGIHVNVLGHRDAYPINYNDPTPTFEAYFNHYINDYCDPDYAPHATIGDYLTFDYFDWTLSGGGKGGTDMMHTKLCAVSHYIDMNGEIHKNAVWTSSSNLDGIYGGGYNANWKLQTATIISDHEDIYTVSVNYLRLMLDYADQEGVIEFQNIMNVETTKQIDLIMEGRGDEIPENERLVYIGTENDDVFELYFTPFGGDILSWSEIYNPYCKYLRELYDSEDYIIFTWNAAEYSGSFPLARQMEQMIIDAFHKNKNPNNKIYANMESFDPTTFDDLVLGVDIGFKSINEWPLGAIHNKDLQFSYVKNGQRYYVSLLNSLNLHGGSMYYQSNSALVIKETSCSENSVFSIVAKYSTNADLTTHTYTETSRQEPTATEHGHVSKVCSGCEHTVIIETLHLGGEWIVETIATPTENGIRYKKCLVCDEIVESEETKYTGSYVDPDANTGTSFEGDALIPVDVNKAPLTMEATILLDRSWNGRGGVIVGNYSSQEDENAINLEIYVEGRVRLFYITNGIRTDVIFSEDIRSTEPVHIAVTVDGSYARLYVNGVLSESVEILNPLPTIDRSMVIGGDYREESPQIFKGKIYAVALFDDVRSDEEILSDKEFVSDTAPNVIFSKYFGSSGAPTYITGNSTGKQFDQDKLTEFEVAESTVGTIEATIMLPTSYADRAGVILGNYVDRTKNTINLEVMPGGMLRLYYINSGAVYSHTFATDIRSDKPVNVALTISGTTASMYLNGTLAETVEIAMALPTMSGAYAIGGDYRVDNAQYFKGTIYSVNVFSTIRSAEEIVSDMLAVNATAEGLIYSTYFTEKGNVSNNGQTFDNNVIGGTACTFDSTPLTFEAVIQLSKDYTDRGGIIVSNNFKSKPVVSFEVFKNGKLRLYFVNGTTTVDCKFDTDVRSDKPIHVALTVDGTTAYLYINGELTETKELALPLPVSPGGYHVGGDFRPNNTQYFKGIIYSVGLFDHVRSATQIKQDMLSVEGERGLIFSTRYIDTYKTTEKDIHADSRFEVVTKPTEDNDGLGRLVCSECGKVLQIHSIPYTVAPVIKNTYTDTNAALKGGEYIIVEDEFGAAPKTFEVTLKLSPSITDRGGVILGNYDGIASGRMNLEIYTNGNPRLWYKVNGTSYSYLFDVDIRSEKNVHLTFTIDGLQATLYVNGSFVQTVELAVEVPYDGSSFLIATDQRISTQSFKGEIYSAAIFADVRTPEEIAHDMIMVTSDAHALLFSKYFVASEGIQVTGPWADKNAIFVGDSITAGTNCEGDKYWQLLEQMLELGSATSMGIPGSCISSTSDYGNDYDPLINRYDDIPEADLITIFMGTNDYGHDTPLGTINDTSDVSFYGALNVIIPALQAKHPNARIVLITPLHRYGFGTNSATGGAHTFDSVPNGAGHTLEDYVIAIKEVCEKYGVDVIDLYGELDLDPSAEETREYYMEDGLHPNTAGHRLIAEFLEHALTVLCEENEQ